MMYQGFEIVEETDEFVIVDKQIMNQQHNTIVIPQKKKQILYHEYENLIHKTKVVSVQIEKLVNDMNNSNVCEAKRDLWISAANCVIKCMADVIEEGEKLTKKAIP